MAQGNQEIIDNQEIIKVCIPVSTKMSPTSPAIHKTPTKHEISDNALTHI